MVISQPKAPRASDHLNQLAVAARERTELGHGLLQDLARRSAVERVISLREQAELLRNLAWSFDPPRIRDELFALAADCERLAKVVSDHLSATPPSVPQSILEDGS